MHGGGGWWLVVGGGGRENKIAFSVEELEHSGAVGTFDFLVNNAHP